MKRPKCFSKIGMAVVLILYAELILFGQIAMWYFGDLSSLDSMWLYAIPPILALLGYFLKSCKENTCGGIVYDTALKQQKAADTETAGFLSDPMELEQELPEESATDQTSSESGADPDSLPQF